MRKKLLLFILCITIAVGCFPGLGYVSLTASAKNDETISYMNGSDLLYDLMETATTFVVAKHKAFGGAHYAYTEGLYEESTGEAPVGAESNFYPGSQLVLLKLQQEGDRVKKTETVILDSPLGCVRDPDVSADGTKVIFSWKQRNTDDFHIYEMSLTDGNYEPKQLTFGSGVADFECIYLPSGEILFSSSRAIQTVDCWVTPVSNIYKMSADGSNIVRLGYDQVHTTYPTLTEDGRVIYTRWDYNDRSQMWVQGMFQMNPDGTNQTELYGNNSNFPTTLVQTRQVPGESDLYISIATGHHSFQAGKLALIDVSEGRDSKDAITFPFPDETTVKDDYIDAYGQSGTIYQYPYAINANQYLVSMSSGGWLDNRPNTPFHIYLMDAETKQQIQLVRGTASYPAAQIVPVKTSEMFVRPSSVDYTMNTGTYYVADVYAGEAMEGIERGTAKQIRVVALDYRAYAVGGTVGVGAGTCDIFTPIATGNGSWDVKQVLGTATVYEDGSALFSVPSEPPVYFQLLDKDGNMIQTMRSWSTLMPNETYSCIGCHEDNNTTPPANTTVTQALEAGVELLKPEVWQTEEDYDPYETKEGFSYLEEVQPILDANCISCHNNKNASYRQINADAMIESGIDTTAITGEETVIFGQFEDWVYRISASDDAPKGWAEVDFDDSSWRVGQAGFGDRHNDNGSFVGTFWSGDNNWIFLRKTFTIDDLSKYKNAIIKLNTFYDDSPTFYINGHEVLDKDGNWVDTYTDVYLDASASKYLKEGENVFAIRLHQTGGGRYVDSALSLIVPDMVNDPTALNPFSLEGEYIGSARMSRYFPLSYLVLTGSVTTGSIQWRADAENQYTNWLSSMSGAELIQPYSYGAVKSNLMATLREGHQGVELTEEELRTIAAWIDLCVPCYGEYDANNHWDWFEMREAEEEQNKRDYYVMMNDYARMAIAGTLPEGKLKVAYQSNAQVFEAEGQGLVNLYIPQTIRTGDTVTVTLPEGVKYIGFTLTPKMGESIIYCPNGSFTYVVPRLSSLVSTLSADYKNTSNYVTVRIPTEEELSETRNLAENTYDYTNNASIQSSVTGQYPHATASSEWENNKGSGETDFLARNAIDGFSNNRGHGSYPVQSWGPSYTGEKWIDIDFGRAVKVEELGIVVRYDVGHDTWFKSATVEVTYADGTTGTQAIDIAWEAHEQIIKLNFDKPITKIRLKDLVTEAINGWAAFTEVKVYGSEVVSE